jgi:sulfide:quinone oxidoreductase
LADQTIVVLGCGMGGVAAAVELRRLLPRRHRVVVIDREARASYSPSYVWLVTGERKLDQISRPRSRLARKGIEFVQADVRELDLGSRQVWADSREFKYDHLVFALGMERTLEAVPGLPESAQSLSTLEAAERLAATLRYFAGGRVVIAPAPNARTYPFAAYEAAMLIEHYFHERKMRQKVEIEINTSEGDPLAFAGPEASETILGLLAHKGIAIVPGRHLRAVNHGRKEAVFSDESISAFDLLVAQPQCSAPRLAVESGLVGDSGWIEVNPETMETSADSVFAIGDSVFLPGLFPGAAFAQRQALIAARQIGYGIEGGKPPKREHRKARFLIEIGAGAATSVEGRFRSGERPDFKQPSIVWHWARRAMERYWLLRTY